MDKLSILSSPAAGHIQFSIFNLVWPNLMFWAMVVVVFILSIRLRIPNFMESDRASREAEMEK